ncbi:MAG: hypothetical protein LBN95_04025 [Prevotellaceae bacterium]|jgi:hypothetical protein|nr:hypothetical protein [Prevotellaceae bacterium]
METTLTKTRTNVISFNPKNQVEKGLTYEIIQKRKREQQRLIDAGIIEKPKIKIGFTVAERIAFDNGTPVEEFFDKIAAKYDF